MSGEYADEAQDAEDMEMAQDQLNAATTNDTLAKLREIAEYAEVIAENDPGDSQFNDDGWAEFCKTFDTTTILALLDCADLVARGLHGENAGTWNPDAREALDKLGGGE